MSKPFFSLYLILVFVFFTLTVNGQVKENNYFTVMFYNVENFFDTINNPLAQDDFTPDDSYEWTAERFTKKRDAIAEVIATINGTNAPDVVGLCEVENSLVLRQLINSTPLAGCGYSIVHHDSPDARGIDVALLYRPERFRLVDSAFIVMEHTEVDKQSREILYAKGIVNGCDTLHVFVVHFPSKRDGAIKTAPLRMAAARALRQVTDSILTSNPQAAVLVTGDFNDTYNSKPLKEGLGVSNNFTRLDNGTLYNLSAHKAKAGEGTTKYRNRWQLVDMFLVSGRMVSPTSALYVTPEDVTIFKPDFLLEYVAAVNSYRPKPTYRWVNYVGGYSDHLPIILRIKGD